MLNTELHISTLPPQFCGDLKIYLVSLLWATVYEVHLWSACFLACMFLGKGDERQPEVEVLLGTPQRSGKFNVIS